jgi:hypothetical protein
METCAIRGFTFSRMMARIFSEFQVAGQDSVEARGPANDPDFRGKVKRFCSVPKQA